MTLLLDKGANVNIEGGDGGAPLHAAAMGRQVEAIRLLAGRKANLERRNRYGRTPLVVAAREMRGVAVIGALLDLGAQIDAADKANDTALTLASWRGSRDVVDLLLARGAAIPIGGAKGRCGPRERGLDRARRPVPADRGEGRRAAGRGRPGPDAPAQRGRRRRRADHRGAARAPVRRQPPGRQRVDAAPLRRRHGPRRGGRPPCSPRAPRSTPAR